ncbi:MAG: HPr family phosphocarrier protein [Clostridia bacterium]
MYRKETTIRNATGLHARPASEFINCAKGFSSALKIHRTDGTEAKSDNAKSMVTILTQAFSCGERVEIIGDGEDEVEAVDTLIRLIDGGFGEV